MKKVLRKVGFGLSALGLAGLLSLGLESKSFASPQNIKLDNVYLTSCVNDKPCSTDNKDVTIEDRVKLNAVVEAHENGNQVYFSDSKDLVLNGKKIDPNLVRPFDGKDIKLNWYKVETVEHTYSNVGSKKKFKWSTPLYSENLIVSGTNFRIDADAHPTNKEIDVNDGLGTMRYKLEVTSRNRKISTPGKDSKDVKGITKDVHRISFRKDNSVIGWMTSFFNLPYIYGSAGEGKNHQAERYIGADCADLITFAANKAGYKLPYTNVRGLIELTDPVLREKQFALDKDTFYKGEKKLFYGSDIKVGDLIFFGNTHVGVITADKSDPNEPYKGKANGILDAYDEITHTLGNPPNTERLGRNMFFSIRRLRKN